MNIILQKYFTYGFILKVFNSMCDSEMQINNLLIFLGKVNTQYFKGKLHFLARSYLGKLRNQVE